MLSTSKKILFTLFPSILLVGCLVGSEFLVRRWAPELTPPLLLETRIDGVDWYQINRAYLRKYFPADAVMLPEFKSSLIRKVKIRGAYRIFCLGESSMFGTPYQMSGTIPALLRTQLRHLFPGREFEVVNFGASAINSNVIRDIVPQLLELDPDLVVIYTGHNEFYGPDGLGASFLEKHFPSLTRFKYRLRDLSLVQGVQALLRSRGASSPADHNMMKEVSHGALIAGDSPDAERVYNNFEANLSAIVGQFQHNNVPVVVSKVTSNLTFPPFISGSAAADDTLRRLISSGDWSSANTLAGSLLREDSTNAMALYCLGMLRQSEAVSGEAERWLTRARDNDRLKFRAPSRINSIIGHVCQSLQAPCLDADSAFSAEAHGIAGQDFFWEHLHPTVRGYDIIARLFLRQILESHLLSQETASSLFDRVIPFPSDSLGVCWLDLAYADLAMRHLTSQWPFTDVRVTSRVIDSSDASLQALARDVYALKMPWDEGCYRTAEYFRQRRDYRNAIITYDALIGDYPGSYSRHFLLGNVYKEMGAVGKASEEYAASIRLNDAFAMSRLELGLLEVHRGAFDAAISQLEAASKLAADQHAPATERALISYGLAAARANKGDYSTAMRFIDQSISLFPSYEPAQRLKQQLLRVQSTLPPTK